MSTTYTSNFEEVANEIIDKSIASIICIDDELAEPFGGEVDGEKMSKELYDSFRDVNCSVEFYKYRTHDEWLKKSLFTFKGRDLLILDWQLAKDIPEHSPTLDIISKAVVKQNLHFMCIYTATQSSDFPDIIYKINSYFAPFVVDEVKADVGEIESILDTSGHQLNEVFDSDICGKLKEMVLYRDQAGKVFAEIRKKIQEKTSEQIFNGIQQFLLSRVGAKVYPTLLHSFCAIGMVLNKEEIGNNSAVDINEIRNYVDKSYLVVNHTIILITNKSDVVPKDLYGKFKEALMRDSGNFLTLMGLEMRNLFKESSGFIGKDIDSINELAFFHHREKSNPPEAFYDFLRELWKSQASSFLYNKMTRPKIFDSLDQYKAEKGIDEKIKNFLSQGNQYEQDLGKLNYYYNILSPNREESDILRFGDIFKIYSKEMKPTDHFFLCITAHCDCLYSEDKIKNLFYFVKGSKGNIKDALSNGDEGFSSFIKNGTKIDTVNWSHKPVTLYVKKELNDISKDISVQFGEDELVLKYHSTLKENYAQRIANNSFVYPLHVGIFFADTKVKK
ncbi:hypothetical protein HGH93_12390 [Chitinophaga polysaccharea]|uniref:response regulator receiver domain n=1 Tax=Chitinophaga polysaccharea TaxID=1293035 RepID=UPI001454E86E|nr:response regulator receiver domain [Chitinophaga polysaccharea]NLR58906.1 hypothetical protein [Chitinophaga polysaccharea]